MPATAGSRPTRRLLTAAACLASVPLAAAPPDYRIAVRVDPAAGAIACTADIRSPASASFWLGSDMTISSVVADGEAVSFRESPLGPGETAREVALAAPLSDRLVVEYAGTVRAESYPEIVSRVNTVGPELVELAGYVGWYPRTIPPGPFTFRLRVDLPSGFVALTNGRPAAPERVVGERTVTEWESYGPAGDLVLLAAPGLRRVGLHRGADAVEIYAVALPQAYLDAMKQDVAAALDVLSDIAGAPPPLSTVRLAYSPRGGWGYVRPPLIVISEAGALSASSRPSGRERDLRYVAHEIAHYWWHFADTETPDDWINEGLAEYASFLAAEGLVGADFAARLLEEYEQRSADSATLLAIAETPGASPEREVNRYVRPVLLLEEMRRRHGDEGVRAFLCALYRRFAESGQATTPDFLDQAERSLGAEARSFFAEALHRTRWGDAAAGAARLTPSDRVFLGTWTGELTQAGLTHRVVLHLRESDGVLVASLDSPDQDAAEIEVPRVRISSDSLAFGIGAFGIAYEGVLDRRGGTIRGEWRQGGAASPLVLRRTR